MRTSTNAYDSQGTVNVTLPIGKPNVGINYAVDTDQPNDTRIKLLNQPLAENVSFRYNSLGSMSSKGLKKIYPNSTKTGFEIRVTNSFVRETVNDTPAAINDDPVQVEFTFRTLDGANYVTGSDVAKALCHTLGFILDVESDGSLSSDQKTLSRLIAGATKPSVLV